MYKFSERPCAYLHGCMCLQRAPSAEEAKYNIFYDIYLIHVYKFCERPCAYLVLTLCVLAAGTVRIHTYIPPGVVDRWAVDRWLHKYCVSVRMIVGRHFNELAAEHKLKGICRVGSHQTQPNQMPRRTSWRLPEPNWMSIDKYDGGKKFIVY